MRTASLLGCAVALFGAAPAFATGTMLCTSTTSPGAGPRLWLSIGSPPMGVVQARLTGPETLTTGEGARAPILSQTWFDREVLRVDIVDANVETLIVRLDTRRQGTNYVGNLIHRGRTWRVRCSEEG